MKRLMCSLMALVLAIGVALGSDYKIPLIGSKAPKISANSTHGKLVFPNDFGDSWKILFSHPADFTPVCTSELLEMAYLQSTFEKLNVKVAVISTDPVAIHEMWVDHLEEIDYKERGTQDIKFPLLEDPGGKSSRMYGMLHEPTSTNRDIRGVFIIDQNNVVRSINFYPMQVGRNMNEIIRMVEALQTTDESHVYTPANWNDGDDVIVPHFPYTKAQLDANPDLNKRYYPVGNRVWFQKVEENGLVEETE